MREANIGIAKEGYPIIFFFSITSLSLAFLRCDFFTIIALLALFFALHFFRDPERVVPNEKDLAVSPADGKIIRIEKRKDPILDIERTCVSIFMNVFSVHVNRSPVQAKVEQIKYYPGLFLNASLDKASTDNERCAYLVSNAEQEQFTFVQVAGLVARRIVCRIKIGDELERGERFGLIRFGSRVDVFLPDNYTASVKIGEQVFAGQSILAKKELG